MSGLDTQVLDEIRRVAREELEHLDEVLLSHRLKEDLHLDSMAMVVVASQLENRFRVMLNEEDAGQINTIEDLVRLVVRRISEAKPT